MDLLQNLSLLAGGFHLIFLPSRVFPLLHQHDNGKPAILKMWVVWKIRYLHLITAYFPWLYLFTAAYITSHIPYAFTFNPETSNHHPKELQLQCCPATDVHSCQLNPEAWRARALGLAWLGRCHQNCIGSCQPELLFYLN